MSEQEKIIDRIKKLLRLADPKRGATPEEAALAAGKAQALLFEHNLTMFNLGDIHKEEKPENIGKEDMTLSNSTYATVKWHRSLVFVISKPLFCRAVSYRGSREMLIIGKPSNVQVVNYLYFYLSSQIEQMAKVHQIQWRLREMREKYGRVSPNESASRKMAYAMGCVMTIQERLESMYREQRAASDNSHALMVVSDESLDAALKSFCPSTGRGPERKIGANVADSMAQGIKDGHNIAIHTGVGSNATQRKGIGHGK